MVDEVNNSGANNATSQYIVRGAGTDSNPYQLPEIVIFGKKPDANNELAMRGTGTENAPYQLQEVTVFAQAKPKKALPLTADFPVLEKPTEIRGVNSKLLAANMIERFGGKMQKREVDGQKQQIAIIKNGKDEVKYLVNEDGTLGEQLVTVSTRGKDKYITKSVHNQNMQKLFPNGVPQGIEVTYARHDGKYEPTFTKAGKKLSTYEVLILVAQQKTEPDNIA